MKWSKKGIISCQILIIDYFSSDFLSKARQKSTKIKISLAHSVSPQKDGDCEKRIKRNISKNLKIATSGELEEKSEWRPSLIPNKKLSFKKQPTNRNSLQLQAPVFDQEALENFTKRSKTEEVNEEVIGSLGEIDVHKRLSKDQKSESFNIFCDRLSLSRSDFFNSTGSLKKSVSRRFRDGRLVRKKNLN